MDALLPTRQSMPLLVLPDHAAQLFHDAQVLLQQLDAAGPRPIKMPQSSAAPPGGYQVDNGTATIPIMGALVPRTGFVGSRYGVTGYDGIAAEMARAVDDDAVERIALFVDSPGGFVQGVDGAAAAIREARARKPVLAVVDGMACSAGYWLASQANAIAAAPLAMIGSIGVIMAHVDATGAYEQAGIKVTLIAAGARKADLHPLNGPLSEGIRASQQERMEKLRQKFAGDVGLGRPALGAARALATEADVFDAADAARRGLIDFVLPAGEALQRFAGGAIGGSRTRFTPPAPAGSSSQVEELDPASYEDGAKAAQTRIAAILTSPHAAGREKLAKRLAFETSHAAADAIAILQDAPEGTGSNVAGDVASLQTRREAATETFDPLRAAQSAGAGEIKKTARLDAAGIYAERRKAMGQG